jgi:hypothetical protein
MLGIIGNVVLVIGGLLALRCLMSEIMLRPATGVVGVLALLASMVYQGFFESYWERGLEYQIMTASLVMIMVLMIAFQLLYWKNGPFKRIIPRMFPII